MSAEAAYVFRHALLREAAYQLQLPGDRTRLHALALDVLEGLCGGKPPGPAVLLDEPGAVFSPHATDRFAEDLAEHAKRAGLGEAQGVYLRRSAGSLAAQFRHDAAASRWQEYAALMDGAERGEALRRAAYSARSAGRAGLAAKLLDEGLREARAARHREAEALNLSERGMALFQAGKAAEAESELVRALELHADRRSRAATLQNYALLLRDRGRIEEGRALHVEVLAEIRSLGEASREATVLRSLAYADLGLGRMESAEALFREAIGVSTARRDRWSAASGLDGLAQLCAATGRQRLSERLSRRAIRIHRALGDRSSEATCLANLANALLELGDAGPSGDLLDRALAIHRELGDRRGEAIALSSLANTHAIGGRKEEAIRLNELALALHREHGARRTEGVILGNLAGLHFELGRFDVAESLYAQGLAALREVRARRAEGALMCDHARMLAFLGRVGEAGPEWREGAAILREVRDTHLLARRTQEMRDACAEAGVAPLDAGAP